MTFERATSDVDHLAWFKSSFSGNEGNCLEVAVEWRKSSHSGNQGGNCIEIAECATAVHVRDSKDVAGPQLQFSPRGWSAFVGFTLARHRHQRV